MTRLSDLRRGELRKAAFQVLQKEGLTGATLEKVAAYAGASKGIVLHYFKNKQELFEHAMREANLALKDAVTARLRGAQTQQERLAAIIETNFDPRFCQPSICHAWLSLCAEVPRDATLARIQRVIHARMKSNLVSALRGLVTESEIMSVALSISVLIDGLWLRLGVQSSNLTPEDALKIVESYVAEHVHCGPVHS